MRDVSGQEFGNLIAITPTSKRDGRRGVIWKCQCKCGNFCEASLNVLMYGGKKSCGCLPKGFFKTHGMSVNSPEYRAWVSMKSRCYDPNFVDFERYGGRGIKVCDEWRDSFENFYADMGPRPSKEHSLDRYPNNDGDYSPINCRWATSIQQHRNKSSNRLLTLNGVTKCMSEWAECLGVSKHVIYMRLKKGWSLEQALTTPLYGKMQFES